MPATLVFNDGRIHTVEIAAAGNCSCNGDRIANLHSPGFCVGRHCEISNCTRKADRRIRRQRFHFKRHRLALDLHLAALANLTKWIREEGIGKWVVLIEHVKRRPRVRAWRTRPARNDNLGFRCYWSDLKFARACRSNRSLVGHDFVRSAPDCFRALARFLQFLRSKPLSGDFGRLDQPGTDTRIKSHSNLNRNDLSDVGYLFRHDQLCKDQVVRAGCLCVTTRPGAGRTAARRAAARIGDV